MGLTKFDWSRLIAEMMDIPPDVVFEIVEDGHLCEIEGHKIVLGVTSPTFKMMFYTTDVGDKTVKKIKIEETTRPAFQIIMDDLYMVKSVEDSLKDKSVREVFDVVNLIERYQMADLQKAVNELLSNYPVTDDTVLDVAAEAMHQNELFQKEAQLLLLTCAMFLRPKLNDIYSIFKYAEENKDKNEVFAALLGQMNGTAPTGPTECSNCGYEHCQNGKTVNEGELREGLLVTNNRATTNPGEPCWPSHDYGTGKVTRVDATHVTIVTINGGIVFQFNGSTFRKTNSNGRNLFLFMCK